MVDTRNLSQHERHHWLGIVTGALEQNPGVLSLLYDRAAVLRSLGAFAEAEEAYRALLARDPGNFTGLIDLSCIFVRQARYVEALALRGKLLELYPQDATALAFFADMILISGDLDAAESFYEQARKLAPHHTVVHRGLAEVMRLRGRSDDAARHEAAASSEQAFFPRQYRGSGAAIPLLLFVSEAEENESAFADRIIDESTFLVTKCIVERITPKTMLPEHRIILNGIGDADRAAEGLARLQDILGRSTAPVINDPAVVGNTGRFAMARCLANIPGVKTPKMLEIPSEIARGENAFALLASHGFTFPLLLRIPQYHAGRYFEKVDSAAEFTSVVASFPTLPILVIEYLDTRGDQPYFHKSRVMVIDGELYPTHLAYGAGWKLHYFSSSMMHEPALREAEARFLADPRATLGERAWRALQAIARAVDLAYFGIDFAVAPSGDVVVFECNAAMVVAKPGPEPHWAYRHSAYQAMMSAADRMVKVPVLAVRDTALRLAQSVR